MSCIGARALVDLGHFLVQERYYPLSLCYRVVDDIVSDGYRWWATDICFPGSGSPIVSKALFGKAFDPSVPEFLNCVVPL